MNAYDVPAVRVFDSFADIPSLSNYKMSQAARKLAEESYNLFVYLFNTYKKKYSIIQNSDFDDNIDIFFLSYCKVCQEYVKKDNKNKVKLSTCIGVAFNSLCENALRHYNTGYMRRWRDRGTVPLDKTVDGESCFGDVTPDTRTDIAAQYETSEKLRVTLEYIDTQIQTTRNARAFNCTGWTILKLWVMNDFPSVRHFLEYLRAEELTKENTTEQHIRRTIHYYRQKLREALDRGEI